MLISPSKNKKTFGKYYTQGNPFILSPFKKWAEHIHLKEKKIVEPFAGSNNIIKLLQKDNFANNFISYDINPTDKFVKKRDTIKNFPLGFDIVITNPPWLAKNSANRQKLFFPQTKYDDLYKYCLDLCLKNCKYVAAIIPATFLQSGIFRERLATFIMLHNKNMFFDTENPVALALFEPTANTTKIYYDNIFIGNLNKLKKYLPQPKNSIEIKFNDSKGQLGFIAFDNTKEPSIRFCKGEELMKYKIKHTTRMITKIKVPFSSSELTPLIFKLNKNIQEFRKQTKDVFLTPFKGLRKDGMYRRRMEYSLARNFLQTVN